MNKLLYYARVKRIVAVLLKDKNMVLAEFRTPKLYYETQELYKSSLSENCFIWLTEEAESDGSTNFFIRPGDVEIEMQDVDQMENDQKAWEASLNKRRAWGVAQGVAKGAAYVAAAYFGFDFDPFETADNIVEGYHDAVGESRSFDRDAFLAANTFEYRSGFTRKTVILYGHGGIRLDGTPVMGTSPNCTSPVVAGNCVSLRFPAGYGETEGIDNFNYATFEFFSEKDAKKTLRQFEKCLKARQKRQG